MSPFFLHSINQRFLSFALSRSLFTKQFNLSLSLSLKVSIDKRKMRRNCNLELRLFPLYDSDHRPMTEEEANESPQEQHCQPKHQQQQNQPLSIFYDGKICVCDVTEFQARSILMLANKETEERVRTPTGSEPSSPLLQSKYNLNSPGASLSMKRSLQRFLQKRKNRIQEASPYHN